MFKVTIEQTGEFNALTMRTDENFVVALYGAILGHEYTSQFFESVVLELMSERRSHVGKTDDKQFEAAADAALSIVGLRP